MAITFRDLRGDACFGETRLLPTACSACSLPKFNLDSAHELDSQRRPAPAGGPRPVAGSTAARHGATAPRRAEGAPTKPLHAGAKRPRGVEPEHRQVHPAAKVARGSGGPPGYGQHIPGPHHRQHAHLHSQGGLRRPPPPTLAGAAIAATAASAAAPRQSVLPPQR